METDIANPEARLSLVLLCLFGMSLNLLVSIDLMISRRTNEKGESILDISSFLTNSLLTALAFFLL